MADVATPVKVTLGDGSVVEGATEQEAFQNLAKMKVDTAAAYKDEKAKRERLEQEVESLKSRPEPKTVKADGSFDNEKYFAMLNQNPVEAQNYLDAYRFGVNDPSQVPSMFIGMSQQIASLTQEKVASAFIYQHAEEFPQTPEAAKELRVRTEKLIAEGHPYNLRTVNLAYQEAVQEGSIKPLAKATDKDDTIQPNPALGGSGSSVQTDAELAKFEKMSTTEQEAYLRSKGLI